MFKPAILLIPLVFCSCAPRQDNVAARSDDKPDEALFPVKMEGQYGYMDRSGKLVLKGPYAGASRFSEGLAAVQMKKAEKVGYIDTTGKMVIALQFDLGDPFSEGFAAVMQDHKWGYIDKTGKIVIPFTFADRPAFCEWESGGCQCRPCPTVWLYQHQGRVSAPRRATKWPCPIGKGWPRCVPLRSASSSSTWTGKAVIPPQFLAGGEFAEGLAPVQAQTPEGVRWGFIDKQGKMVIPAKYTNALPFAEGLAPVQELSGKWGFVDAKNNMVINPQWDQAASFAYGLSQVWAGDKFGYIGTDGKYVWHIQ